jgi:carboxypeptidase Taq
MDAGRIDISTHPFCSGFNPNDVRMTTRYRPDDILYSIGSTIHETGHGLYEQGLLAEHFGTPLSESVSLGIHESQSRMWENIIGKSEAFWKHFYPKLQKDFPKPFKKLPLKEFLKTVNKVNPSLIRTEADEVTYNLHVILRFEIEKDMIEGKIKLEDLPEIWNSKVKKYLGIEVPNDTLGVLQDVHWSTGGIGYFPTYSLGNLYSAQFYAAMKKNIPDIEKQISGGRFDQILGWLRKNIHNHGKIYKASELVKKVTGEKLSSKYFNEYIQKKYTDIYSL